MKYATARPYAGPEKPRAGSSKSPMRSSRFKGTFTSRKSTSRSSSVAGVTGPSTARAQTRDRACRIRMHESGTFVTFTLAGAELFA